MTVVTVILTPVTYLGNYSDLGLPTLVSTLTAFISLILVLVNSFLYHFVLGQPGDFEGSRKVEEADGVVAYFVAFGTLVFSSTITVIGISSTFKFPLSSNFALRGRKLEVANFNSFKIGGAN